MATDRDFVVKNGLTANTKLTVGNTTINAVTNSTSMTIGATVVNTSVVAVATGNFSTGANVGANVNLTTAGISIGNSTVNVASNSSLITVSGSTVWHAGNDGAGSGLDADLLDGLDWTAPGTIGSSTANTGKFTTIQASGGNRSAVKIDKTGSTVGRLKMFVGDGTGGYAIDENYIESLNTGLHIMGGATGTTEVATVLVNGNVGIGNTAPAHNLSVNGTGYFGGAISVAGSTVWHAGNDGAGSGLDADLLDGLDWTAPGTIGSSTANTGRFTNVTSTTNVATFGTSTYLVANGNVGIGTASPVTKLHAIGGITTTQSGQRPVGATEKGSYLVANDYDGVRYYGGQLGFSLWFDGTNYKTGTDGGSNGGSLIQAEGSSHDLSFYTIPATGPSQQTILPSSLASYARMIITNAGNVGIGTTSPGAKLEVYDGTLAKILTNFGGTSKFKIESGGGYSTIGTITNSVFAFVTADTERMRIETSGNVGIGNTAPAHLLSVNGTGYFGSTLSVAGSTVWHAGNDGAGSGLDADLLDGLDWTAPGTIGSSTANTGRFTNVTSTTNVATFGTSTYLVANGNVGIGTTSPTATLDVFATAGGIIKVGNASGSGKFSADGGGTSVGSDSNHNLYLRTNNIARATIDTSGQVGIGTNSPVGKLSVASGAAASGFSISAWDSTYSIFGPNAGSTTGSALAIGYSSVDDASNIVSLQPGVAWRPLRLASGGLIILATNGAESMRVTSGGEVGIGNTAPAHKLSVNGTGYFGGTLSVAGSTVWHAGNDGAGSGLDADLMDGLDWTAPGTIGSSTANTGRFTNVTSTTNVATFGTSTYLVANGNVGVGTASPVTRLNVVSNAASDTTSLITVGGITEATGSYTGILLGGAGAAGVRYKGGLVYEPTATTYGLGKLHILLDATADNSDANLSDAKITILNNGDVGIGNTAPGHKLSVNGSTYHGGNVTSIGSIIDTPVTSHTAGITISETYAGKVCVFENNTNAVTVTVGTVTTPGFSTTLIRNGTNTITIANGVGLTINKTVAANTLRVQYSSATLVYTATNVVTAIGDFG